MSNTLALVGLDSVRAAASGTKQARSNLGQVQPWLYHIILWVTRSGEYAMADTVMAVPFSNCLLQPCKAKGDRRLQMSNECCIIIILELSHGGELFSRRMLFAKSLWYRF